MLLGVEAYGIPLGWEISNLSLGAEYSAFAYERLYPIRRIPKLYQGIFQRNGDKSITDEPIHLT